MATPQSAPAAAASGGVRPVADPTSDGGGGRSRLPDHPFRAQLPWQLFTRGWRPFGAWVVCLGLLYAFVVGPLVKRPLEEGTLLQLVLMAFGLWGLKTYEKRAGVE